MGAFFRATPWTCGTRGSPARHQKKTEIVVTNSYTNYLTIFAMITLTLCMSLVFGR